MIREKAYAKINLHLEVFGKRENGYHDVATIMQAVSLCDTLTFRKAGEGISLTTDCSLPIDEGNLIVRAAKLFFARLGSTFGVGITLEKRIPVAAGLGGGSADAAATLRALNRLAGEPFSVDALREMAGTLGADIPFLVNDVCALCTGIGERVLPIENRTDGHFVIAIGKEGMSTPEAFARLDEIHENYRGYSMKYPCNALQNALAAGDTAAACSGLYNSFEEAILPIRPEAAKIRGKLYEYGALAAQMSGSGPSVFGWFDSEANAANAEKQLLSSGVRAFACRALATLK